MLGGTQFYLLFSNATINHSFTNSMALLSPDDQRFHQGCTKGVFYLHAGQ